MTTLCFEWDTSKAASNLKKHGISFDEAKTVFCDEHAKLIADPDHSEAEDRFILLGHSVTSRLLVVCHCYRHNQTMETKASTALIRIISARKATKQETGDYHT